MDIINQRLKDLQAAMRQAATDMDQMMKLMAEFKDTQQLRDMLARRLGSDVIR
jgi:DNA primase